MDPFTTNFVNYLRASIFPGIISGFANKGHVVTEDELLNMIQQAGLSAPPMVASVQTVPGEARTVKPKGNKTSTVTDTKEPGRCHYEFSKGENRNKFCGKATTAGNEYCAGCLKNNKTLIKQLSSTGAVPTSTAAQKAVSTIPGFGVPQPFVEGTTPLIPAIPAMGSIPGFPAIPAIPAIPSTNQLPSNIPQLPTIKPLN
jgi:hypothetical protein